MSNDNRSNDNRHTQAEMADVFSEASGDPKKTFTAGEAEIATGGSIGQAFLQLGRRDPRVMLVCADGGGPVGYPFAGEFPDRFVDLGIAEANAFSVAAGLAAEGFHPFFLCMAAFTAMKGAEHLRTDLASTRMPVRILSAWSGLSMAYFGPSHVAVEELGIARAIPGLTIVAPCDANAAAALFAETADHQGPIFFRLGAGDEKPVYAKPPVVARGRFINVRDGRDVTLIGTGRGVQLAVEAAEQLAQRNINARVLDAAYIKPIDEAAIVAAARETGGIVTVEEHSIAGGLGSAVAETLARNGVACKLRSVALPDEKLLVATPAKLFAHYGLTADNVAQKAQEVLA